MVSKILQALDRHQSTYLATPDWLSKPWSTHPKSRLDQVFDFCSLAPEIFQHADKIDGLSPHDALHKMIHLVDRCWKIDAALGQFYTELESNALGPLYWHKLARENNLPEDVEAGKVFPVAFHFPNLYIATTMMYYWSTLLMLRAGLCGLYQAIASVGLNCREIDCGCVSCNDKVPANGFHIHRFKMSQLLPLGQCLEFPSIAWNICQSVEYCMQETMLSLGPTAVSAPLAIVIDTMKVLPGYDREVSWAKAAVARVTERGLRILKY